MPPLQVGYRADRQLTHAVNQAIPCKSVGSFLWVFRFAPMSLILVESLESKIFHFSNYRTSTTNSATVRDRIHQVQHNRRLRTEVGLALKLSSHDAILVTTKVPPSIGVPRPLRLTVRKEGFPASIESVVDTTLKLTLLHHGALKPPRVPMPIYGADRMAYLKLNGIYPSVLEGDRQFWL